MKAHVILETVAKTLNRSGNENGYDKQEERSAAEIAKVFEAKTGLPVTEREVWQMLMSLKEVRLKRQLANGSDPTDTLIDLIGYTALLAECLTER